MKSKKIAKPKLDLVFKKIFGSYDNLDLLTDLLASVLDVEPNVIKEIQIVDNELVPDTLDKKYSRLDLALKMIDSYGSEQKIDIEIQVNNYGDYKERSLYYTAKLFSKDLGTGEEYGKLQSTMSINIIDFNLFDYDDYHSSFLMYERNHKDILLTDKFRVDFIELPKSKKHKKNNRLQKWVDFLNVNTEEELNMVETTYENNPIIYRATAIVRKMSADEKLLYESEKREETLLNERLARGYEREQGMIEGEKKGIVKGKIEGKIEERNSMIQAMRKNGFTEEQIQKVLDSAK